jgi:hypothetical protein
VVVWTTRRAKGGLGEVKEVMGKIIGKYGVTWGVVVIIAVALIIYFTDIDLTELLQLLGVQ